MSVAPLPQLTAGLHVMYRAILRARLANGWRGGFVDDLPSQARAEVAELLDAIHNIPSFLLEWDPFKEMVLRGNLARFDEAAAAGVFPPTTGAESLLRSYDDLVRHLQVETGMHNDIKGF